MRNVAADPLRCALPLEGVSHEDMPQPATWKSKSEGPNTTARKNHTPAGTPRKPRTGNRTATDIVSNRKRQQRPRS